MSVVSMEQDQAANNEVGGIQQRRNPQHKQLQQQRELEKESRLHCMNNHSGSMNCMNNHSSGTNR